MDVNPTLSLVARSLGQEALPVGVGAIFRNGWFNERYYDWRTLDQVQETVLRPESAVLIRMGTLISASSSTVSSVTSSLFSGVRLVDDFVTMMPAYHALQVTFRVIRLRESCVEAGCAIQEIRLEAVSPMRVEELVSDEIPEYGSMAIYETVISPATSQKISGSMWSCLGFLESSTKALTSSWEVLMRLNALERSLRFDDIETQRDARQRFLWHGKYILETGESLLPKVSAYLREVQSWTPINMDSVIWIVEEGKKRGSLLTGSSECKESDEEPEDPPHRPDGREGV